MSTILTDDEIDAICDRVLDTNGHTCGSLIARAVEAALLAKLAQQTPVAWVIPGKDNADAKGWIDAKAWEEDEFTQPLYTRPAPQQADRQRVPEGYVLVPVVPTSKMLGAADREHAARDLVSIALISYQAMLAAAPEAPAQGEQAAEPVRDEREPSPTAGMTLWQRILHVGGRTNAAGYVEFGSVQAVDALVRHVLRDLPDAAPEAPTQDVVKDERFAPGGVFVPNDIAWGIVGSTGHARKKAVDALHALLKAAPEAPAQASAVDERQPLTPERVDELSHEMVRGNKSVNWLVRAIERAHGIGDSALAQKAQA